MSQKLQPLTGSANWYVLEETVKKTCSTGDPGLIPELGRSPGEGNGNPLQYSCLKTPMDRGVWQVIVHGVANSWT